MFGSASPTESSKHTRMAHKKPADDIAILVRNVRLGFKDFGVTTHCNFKIYCNGLWNGKDGGIRVGKTRLTAELGGATR